MYGRIFYRPYFGREDGKRRAADKIKTKMEGLYHFQLHWASLSAREQRTATQHYFESFENPELLEFRRRLERDVQLKRRLAQEWSTPYGRRSCFTAIIIDDATIQKYVEKYGSEAEQRLYRELIFPRKEYHNYVIQSAQAIKPPEEPHEKTEEALQIANRYLQSKRLAGATPTLRKDFKRYKKVQELKCPQLLGAIPGQLLSEYLNMDHRCRLRAVNKAMRTTISPYCCICVRLDCLPQPLRLDVTATTEDILAVLEIGDVPIRRYSPNGPQINGPLAQYPPTQLFLGE